MKFHVAVVLFLFAHPLFAQTQHNSQSPVLQKEDQRSTPSTSAPAVEQSKIDPAKEADIRRLLDLAGTTSLMTQLMQGMEKDLKPMMARALPAGDYRDKLVDLFFLKFHSKLELPHLLDMAVPVYDKYYSHEEIKGLIQFYGTPLGQKMVSVMPKMSVELQNAGRQWGEGIGRDSMREVLSEHPDLGKALSDATKSAQSN
ncbi:MAG TPA: DUF2059 domain-containing protein [Terriglobales bacterium]|nr:DUF2059 domain-containing protein [Terriglobales bacterium]